MNTSTKTKDVLGRTSLAAVLILASDFLCAGPVTVPAGTQVPLELQHHVTSSYVPAGTPIYFRVAHDVTVGDATVIHQGTLVIGKMEQATDRGMVGRSGSMALDVRAVTAVDGTAVPVSADLSKQGRSRAGATIGWTVFWGIPGLITQGVNPYLERGATLEANVLSDTLIDPARASLNGSNEVHNEQLPLALVIKNYKFEGGSLDKLNFDIERNKDLKTVTFQVALPPEIADPVATLGTLQLLTVDGVPVPEEVHANSATDKSVTFDGWSIVRYCRDGVTELEFRSLSPAGQALEGKYEMRIKVSKKG